MKHTNSRELINISNYLKIILLLGLSHSILCLNFQMLFHYQDSKVNLVPITIPKSLIPDHFWLEPKFTISMEMTFTISTCFTGNHTHTLFLLGDSSTPSSFSFSCISDSLVFDLMDSTNVLTIRNKFKKPDLTSTFVLNFVFEIETVSFMKLVFLKDDAPNTPKKGSLEITQIPPSEMTQVLFVVQLLENPDISTEVRNISILDKWFDPLEAEYHERYRGLALLRKAIYFYMEPENTKFLLNRSKLNESFGVNGKTDEYCWELHSHLNREKRATIWTMQSFTKEIFYTDLDFLKENMSFSIVLNLEIFPRFFDPDYLNAGKLKPHVLVRLLDKANTSLVNLYLIFRDFDEVSGLFSYTVKFVNEHSMDFYEILLSENISDKGQPLGIESIQIYIKKLSISDVNFQMTILRKNNPEILEQTMVTNLVPIDFETLYIGDPLQEFPHDQPIFVINLFDLLLFEGGYFLTAKSSQPKKDIRMVSIDSLEIMYCEGNSRPSRHTGNALLDQAHELRLQETSNCSDMVFNDNCMIDNCEICAVSTCLVCEIPFILENGRCEMQAQEFEPLSRIDFHQFGQGVNELTIYDDKHKTKSFDPSLLGLSVSIYNNVIKQTSDVTNKVDLKDTICYVYTAKTIESELEKHLFGEGKDIFTRFYVPLDDVSHEIDYQSFEESLTLLYVSFHNLCTNDFSFYNGHLAFRFCKNKKLDFLGNSYFPKMIDTDSVKEHSFDLQMFGSNNQFSLSCQNNCECRSAVNKNQCDFSNTKCSSSQYKIVSSSISGCFDCHPDCLGECSGPLRSDCALPLGPSSGYSSKTYCEFPCEQCDSNFNCVSCPLHPENVITLYDTFSGSFYTNNHKYCKRCRSNCLVCESNDTCKCEKLPDSLHIKFDVSFNVCVREKCNNCINCVSPGKCKKCRKDYFLIDGVCKTADSKRCSIKGDLSECEECAVKYTKNRDLCVECSSFCLSCLGEPNYNTFSCKLCINDYFLYDKKCVKIPYKQNTLPLLNPPLGIFQRILPNTKAKKMHCKFTKKKDSSLCLHCKDTFFLSPKRGCIKCPSNSLGCIYKNQTTKITLCKSGH